MDDPQVAARAFTKLGYESFGQLIAINDRTQTHNGEWGETTGGEKDENGVMQMPYVQKDPLIQEFLTFMYENDFVINFNWSEWDEGREWYKLTDESKYEKLDVEMALKLLSAVIRNDRFHEGALVEAFESGDFPKIINKLTELKEV